MLAGHLTYRGREHQGCPGFWMDAWSFRFEREDKVLGFVFVKSGMSTTYQVKMLIVRHIDLELKKNSRTEVKILQSQDWRNKPWKRVRIEKKIDPSTALWGTPNLRRTKSMCV